MRRLAALALAQLLGLTQPACMLFGGLHVEPVATSAAAPGQVAAYVSVTRGDEPVRDLPAEAFTVLEDGQALDPAQTRQVLLPRDDVAAHRAVLLVDMSAPVPEGDERARLVTAVGSLVTRIRAEEPITVFAFDGGSSLRPIGDFSRGGGAVTELPALTSYVPADSSSNLGGAIVAGLRQLDARLLASGKPVRVGTLVVFARGPDLAGRVSPDGLDDALDATAHRVFAIGVRGSPGPRLGSLGRSGVFEAAGPGELGTAFEDAGDRIAAAVGGHYLLAYCSPARAGSRRLRVEVTARDREEREVRGSFTTEFDATGFGAGCDPSARPRFVAVAPKPRETPPPADSAAQPAPRPRGGGRAAPPRRSRCPPGTKRPRRRPTSPATPADPGPRAVRLQARRDPPFRGGMSVHAQSAAAEPSRVAGTDPCRPPRSEPRNAAPSRGRVLIVDDDPTQVRSAARLLRHRGYQTSAAASGSEASALLRSEQFDAILSDIAMPGMDGIALLQFVRREDLDVPVVLVTGEPAVSTAVKALEYGAFHYLTKPVNSDDLEAVIDKAVCLRRMTAMKREAAELLGNPTHGSDMERLGATFDRALESIWVAYQPILSARPFAVYGNEALLRSGEPSLPHPGAVLDAAERLGRLELLGRTIRDRAAGPAAENPGSGMLFVNLHTMDLLDPALTSPEAPLSRIASRVVLEITERASLEQVKDVRGRVATLREMGFRIAVDDLGAGYAGLTSFALLEPEIVKLDMTLVRDVHQSATKQKLIRSMCGLCHDMGMLVVGEGVENAAERDSLVELGCDLLQGYHFAKPGRPFPAVELPGAG